MQRITIGRLKEDPEVQGVVRPEDNSWQLVIDKEGFPHLWVRTNVELEKGKMGQGMMDIDDVLPEGMTIKELMQSSFHEPCEPPEGSGEGGPCPKF